MTRPPDSRADRAGPAAPLADLLARAGKELAAQPLPPLPAALLQPASLKPSPAASRGAGWLGGRRPLWVAAATGFALLAGATWLVLGPALPPRADTERLAASAAGRFVPVVSTERWLRLADEGASPAWLMTADLPAERLAAYGLPYDPGRADEPVRTELLLNPAGEVLALRVVARPLPSPRSTPRP